MKLFWLVTLVLGLNGMAHAGWEPILKLSNPDNATPRQIFVDREIYTSQLKLQKVGSDCRSAKISFRPIGKLTNGLEVYLTATPQADTADGARIFDVSPRGTIYKIEVWTNSPAKDCTYTFSSHVIN